MLSTIVMKLLSRRPRPYQTRRELKNDLRLCSQWIQDPSTVRSRLHDHPDRLYPEKLYGRDRGSTPATRSTHRRRSRPGWCSSPDTPASANPHRE